MDEVLRTVRLRIREHQRGIFCRAVMWEAIRCAVTEENVCRALDSLAPEERKYLRAVYEEFPPSLWSDCPSDELSRCAVIEQWCQQPD
jgi:hypothetical protein